MMRKFFYVILALLIALSCTASAESNASKINSGKYDLDELEKKISEVLYKDYTEFAKEISANPPDPSVLKTQVAVGYDPIYDTLTVYYSDFMASVCFLYGGSLWERYVSETAKIRYMLLEIYCISEPSITSRVEMVFVSTLDINSDAYTEYILYGPDGLIYAVES